MGKKYGFSFTAGNLFAATAPQVASVYLSSRDWEKVKEVVLRENLMQARAHSSLTRMTSEIISRLKVLTDAQLELLVAGTQKDQRQILWLAACKQSLFVREFADEVLRRKFISFSRKIGHDDFDIFFNNKAEWEEDLTRLTNLTREKIRQVLFLMMVEAELISPEREIIPSLLTPLVVDCIRMDDPEFFSVFPLFDRDIMRNKE